jgi:asparagine synthase (glutamine-hydrolysing)
MMEQRIQCQPEEGPQTSGLVDGVTVRQRGDVVDIWSDRFGAVPLYAHRNGRSVTLGTARRAFKPGQTLARVPAGALVRYANGALQLLPRRHLEATHNEAPAQLTDILEHILRESKPQAVLLSGGIDSCTLLALAHKHNPTVVALSADDGANDDDLARSQQMARHLGVEHVVCRISTVDRESDFGAAVRACEAPLYDHRAVTRYLLYKHAAQRGWMRIASGTGADEVLMGKLRFADRCFRHHWTHNGFALDALPLERTCGRALGVRVLLPYLHDDFVAAAWYRPTEQLIRGNLGKWALRVATKGLVPDNIRLAPKTPILLADRPADEVRRRAAEILKEFAPVVSNLP